MMMSPAVSGPWFTTFIATCAPTRPAGTTGAAPGMTGSGESVFVTDRSAQGRMVVLAWAPLLLGSRSGGEPDVTVAVLMAVVPHTAALTTLMMIRTWAVPPDGSDVAVQVTSSP